LYGLNLSTIISESLHYIESQWCIIYNLVIIICCWICLAP
jgi:hypothetical protein